MKKTVKSAKKTQPKKTNKEYFFSWECIKNNTVNILVIVAAIAAFNYFRTPVFKIDTTVPLCYESSWTYIPNFDTEESQISFNWFNIFNANISNVDLSGIGDKIKFMSFDENVIFPPSDKLPAGFNPETVLENGKDPGLGVRDLHAKGITGKGIAVAIIDNALNINNKEIKDNLIHYEVLGKTCLNYHGPMVSSLLCGKTTGVAPDAKLVYFASGVSPVTQEEEYSLVNDIAALKKILNMNKRLPKDKRISAVSISRGWYKDHKDYAEFRDIENKLIESGVMVLHPFSDAYDSIANFGMLDRKPNANPDDIASYSIHFAHPYELLAPSGGRTGTGPENYYMYWGVKDGGMSWVNPYIVGVYALAKQVYPDLMPKEFFEIARETGYRLETTDGNYNILIQPTKIIEYLQNKNVK